jgi:hypothetical protein
MYQADADKLRQISSTLGKSGFIKFHNFGKQRNLWF